MTGFAHRKQTNKWLFERQPNQTYVGNGLCAVPQKIACNFLISEGNNIELPCGNLILFQNHGTAHRPFPTRTFLQIPIHRSGGQWGNILYLVSRIYKKTMTAPGDGHGYHVIDY